MYTYKQARENLAEMGYQPALRFTPVGTELWSRKLQNGARQFQFIVPLGLERWEVAQIDNDVGEVLMSNAE